MKHCFPREIHSFQCGCFTLSIFTHEHIYDFTVETTSFAKGDEQTLKRNIGNQIYISSSRYVRMLLLPITSSSKNSNCK